MKFLLRISIIFVVIFLPLVHSCKKEKPAPPVISTSEITSITQVGGNSGGNITNDGGEVVTIRGVCWSSNASPTINDNKTNDGTGTGSFISTLSGLIPGTTYFVRAYATNDSGTGYGEALSFTTLPATKPILSTSTATSISQNSAICGGVITSDGAASIITRGVCWSTTSNPTISDSKTTDGSGTGSFVSNITGLIGNTTYYIRAYATNSVGTEYGNQEIILTSPLTPSISTVAISSITSTSATSGGNISNDGGSPVNTRGVCFSLNQNPTITDGKTNDGSGNGIFSSNITGLSPASTYYVRAYATNSVGISYGNQQSFSTSQNIVAPAVVTSPITTFTYNSATVGGNVTSDGNSPVTERGVYWGTSQNSETTGTKLQIGNGTGIFSVNITGLNANTPYYVRAYAVNSIGTTLAGEESFSLIINQPGALSNDVDGNVYHSVIIGKQVWMVENLKTTKYNDGTAIPLVTDNSEWYNQTTSGYCWYNNDESSYKSPYGALYNWYAVNTGKLCPQGWHVPNDSDWTALKSYLGEPWLAGGKMMESGNLHWQGINTGATNESGFTALPGGYRTSNFYELGSSGYFRSTTESNDTHAKVWYLLSGNTSFTSSSGGKLTGYSVRCLKD